MANSEICRVQRSKQEARAAYDRMSRWYDQLAGSSEWQWIQVGLEALQAQEGERILDLGCGTGRALAHLSQHQPQAKQLLGLDQSAGMLGVAAGRIGAIQPSAHTYLVQGDATANPFPSARFDALFMSFTLELFDTPDIPTVLGECMRLLHPAGRLIVVSMVRDEKPSLMVRLYEWLHGQIPKYFDCRPIHAAQSMNKAGFKLQKIERQSMWGLPVEIVTAIKPEPIDAGFEVEA